MFWTDADNRALVKTHFTWFLETYDNMPHNVQRADIARIFYMLQHGGCYFDLDFESLRPLDSLLPGVKAALGYMNENRAVGLSIPNAFMASAPNHDFWWFVLRRAISSLETSTDIFVTTGPVLLRDAVEEYERAMTATSKQNELTIFPPKLIYGVDFDWGANKKTHHLYAMCHLPDKDFNSTKCKENFKEAYTVTYWSGDLTWNG